MLILKYFKFSAALILLSSLFVNNVFAQQVIFSSDQWPKRWGRVMQHQSMNAYVKSNYPARNVYRKEGNRFNGKQHVWGQPVDNSKNIRSKVPEYRYKPNNNLYMPVNIYPQLAQYNMNPIAGAYNSYPMLPAPMLMGYGFNMNLAYPVVTNQALGFPGVIGLPGIGYPW